MSESDTTERRRFERRTNDKARGRIEAIREQTREDYRRHGRRTIRILAALLVVQIGFGIWAITISGRQGDVEANARGIDRTTQRLDRTTLRLDRATRRLNRAICAEVHYLERGEQLTGLDPKQSIVNRELRILLRDLRPLAGKRCPPAEPFTPPGVPEGAWENPNP